MKQPRIWQKLTVLLVGLFGSASSVVACEKEMLIRISADYQPFSVENTDAPPSGIDVEFIRMVMAQAGCSYQFIFQPWKRAVLQLQRGQLDMMPFASITPERQEFAYFSTPYRNETVGLVIRKEDRGRYDISSLQGVLDLNMRLGHTQGAYRGPDFEAFLGRPETENIIFKINFTSQGIKMLLNNRIDALVEMPAASLAVARDLGVEDRVVEHPYRIFSEPVHFMYSKKTVDAATVKLLNQAISELVESPQYQALYGSMGVRAKPIM